MSVESEAAASDPRFFFWDKLSLREVVLWGSDDKMSSGSFVATALGKRS
jgi:hypothetical protein